MSQTAQSDGSRKRLLGVVLRLALSAALLGYLLSRLDRQVLGDAISGVPAVGWLLAVLVYLLSQVVSAVRWAGLARPIGFHIGWLRFGQLYFEGMFFSLCLPSSIGGDVVKALRLGGDGRGRILAGCTVLADRLAGLVAVVLIGLTALAQRTYSLSPVQTGLVAIALSAMALAATRIGFAVLHWPGNRIADDHPLTHFLQRLLPYHRHPYVFWTAIGWSAIVQGLNVVTVMVLGDALGLELPLVAYCIAVPVVALLTVLPISLNGVGVREGGLVWILSTYGVSEAHGVALGLLWLSVSVVTGLIGGLVYLFGPPLPQEPNRAQQPQPTKRSSEPMLCSK